MLKQVHVVLPAAGSGQRMAADLPKQYLELLGTQIIDHTVRTFVELEPASITVVVAPADARCREIQSCSDVSFVEGGASRAESVLAGLNALIATGVDRADWVMVHDAVRPLVTAQHILLLAETCQQKDTGGLLAVPVTDTVKQVSGERVEKTLDREVLWQAQTPQMFPIGLLLEALQQTGPSMTDEASAMEQVGYQPLVVEGSRDNIKITTPADLDFASWLLTQRTGS